MEATVPQTLNYMLAGYACLLGLPLLYVASWLWRRRQYEQHLALLRSLQPDSGNPHPND
jgi:hypothetical protein